MNFSPRGNIGNMGSLEIIGKIRIKWKIWNIGKMGGKDYIYMENKGILNLRNFKEQERYWPKS